MPSYLYKPDHPMANEKGFVEKSDYYYFNSLTKEDKRMMMGNKPVTFHYISDEMQPTMHMCNGKYYTSKKKFRDETRARGCIEVGNDTAPLLKPRKPILPDKRERIEQIKQVVKELKDKQTRKERKKKGFLDRWVSEPNFKT